MIKDEVMRKRILVLTGGARKNGNSDKMADAFVRGAKEAGHDVVKFETAKYDLKGCIYCDTCYSRGERKACSHDDAFNELAPYYESSDMVVFVTPLYWYTFTAQIKAAIDKFYVLMIGKQQSNIRETMLLTCGTGADMYKYEGIIKTYELIVKIQKWTDRGYYVAPGVTEVGDIDETGHLEKITELGRSI